MHKHFTHHFLRTATLVFAVAAAAESLCDRKCGNVDVPYPFGVDYPRCAKDGDVNFVVDCNRTYSPPKPYLRLTSMEVVAISLENATISVRIRNSFKCYDESGHPIPNQTLNQSIALGRSSPFTFSSTENKLVGIGCDTIAFMSDADGMFGSGCISLCAENVDFARESSCSGLGCCKTSVPKRVKSLDIRILTMDNDKRSDFLGLRHCDFAMLVARKSFNVTKMRLDFAPGDPAVDKARVLLDWVAGNETCEDALAKGGASYACGPNTECSYSDSAVGYRCRCSKGFRGNPYSKAAGEGEGCQDIDECEDHEKYTCEGHCKNTIGDYECKCPFLMTGDGKVNCKRSKVTAIITVVAAIIFAIAIALLIVLTCERRKKERVFRENGGLILKHQRVRLFSNRDLAKATNNYDDGNILGQGGFATVYKGVLAQHDRTTAEIAVKRPKDGNSKLDIDKKQQFHEEIAIVSQINHVNAVKLLGLCLETKVPLLVYECVSNGTLFRHIHGKKPTLLTSWKTRLRIAAETALALDYLHSLAHPPIIHRDVKSTNILLDENFTAKVSDFGASVLVPPGQTWIATSVQGTPGYLDPEYLITGTLTTKSDVYSFGVVLVELLTGEKPISKVRTGPKSNIIQYFVSAVREKKEDYVGSIVDAEIARDENDLVQIEAVAELATRCLEISGEMRPSMKEVAEELGRLNKLNGDSKAPRRSCGAESERCSFEVAECFTHHASFSDSSELKQSVTNLLG